MSYSDVYTVSYNCLDVFKTKREAQKFYTTCYHCSEGAEQQRYASILVNLNFSNLGKDNVSKSCDEIHIKLQGNKDKFITIKLDDYLSIDNTIKYYEENIKPILDISEAYNIDFNNDYIIVVIDNILENIDIRQDIKDLNIFCRKYSNIKLINTQSFEVEILRVDDIEYLGDVSEYNKYFRKLKNITNTTAMTMKVKNDEVYEPLINKAVELKRKKRSRYSDAQILASISKLILNKVFAGNANLKPI